ncbi:MAG: type II toxin-antitoxin system HicB family antitoxin [Chloroflexi bacterium]|nr:type II toxin-antitoxin system HicB family antitoxin [Chloroflexota bacterium]
MTYNILIRKQAKGGYVATALGWPEFVAEAATRVEALERIRATLAGLVARGELVEIELPLPQSLVPASYADTFGAFRHDPTFKRFVNATRTYHRTRNRN